MSVADDEHDRMQLTDEAVAWVQLLDSGRATAAELAALKAWRARSAAHESSYVDARRLWQDFAVAAGEMRAYGELPRRSISAGGPPMPSRRLALGGLAAASAAVYLGIRPPLRLWPSITELGADYRTGTGEQRRLAVAADVTMHLNTQ